MTDLVAHLLIFGGVAVLALMAPLVIGQLLRPSLPTPEKIATYECGEPTIGSSYVQFDLRFYVVALLFIIFDVEVVFFFPWVLAFGGATQLADTRLTDGQRLALSERLLTAEPGTLAPSAAISSDAAWRLSCTAFVDVLFFFAVLLVGFAYVWKRGDLDWVRAVTRAVRTARPVPTAQLAGLSPSTSTPRRQPVVAP